MLNRRSLFATAAGTLAGSTLAASKGMAAATAGDIEPRGSVGRLERLPSLDLEGIHDFTAGFRSWHGGSVNAVADARAKAIFKELGVDSADLTEKEILALVENDPIITMSGRLWLSNQQVTWRSLADRFHARADEYLAEMESYDKRGPGSLELNPDLDIPDYAKHEIHIQPGGYVGDPFAGHLYHYGTNSFYHGSYRNGNDQDEIHTGSANALPIPADGKVKRILDLGCGIGQLTVGLKERFPDAEVWGLDASGPMIRYGHMRAVDLGVGVNFAQRMAEATHFPDNHFDIVASYLMHHEVPAAISKDILREAHRVTRPGGYYYPIDFRSGRQAARRGSPYGVFRGWWDHRWNGEIWRVQFTEMGFEDEMEKAGLILNPDAKAALRRFGIRHGVKRA
jgi:SAM-dependent methyltransferase